MSQTLPPTTSQPSAPSAESATGRTTDHASPVTGPRDRYAVIGNPIGHSKSPFIHARFAEQTGEPIEYTHLLAPIDAFAPHVRAFIEAGGRGLNVTVPFKLEAHSLATKLSPRAAAAGAVNTLRFEAGDIHGDNTDGFGLVRDIEVNLATPLKGARILLLGAGGAARGVVLPMLERAPRTLTIVNRTGAKASALVDQFSAAAQEAGCRLSGGNAAAIEPARLRRHHQRDGGQSRSRATRVRRPRVRQQHAGLRHDVRRAADGVHAHAQTLGARAADGLGMLVEQAAESFYIWRGVRPEGAPVLAELRQMLSAPTAT